MPWGGESPVQRPPPEQLRRVVRAFVHTEAARLRAVGPDKLSGLAVARMLSGLSSPAFPADMWRRVTEWGRLQAVDFGLLVAAADAELPVLWDS
jgi:ATP-dependent DNA helicase Q4